MAKRELIDRNNLEITTIVTDDFSGNEVLDVVLMEDVKEAPVITEQEIVKPYLEKLKAEIGKSKTEHEMQIAERDIKAKLLISNIYCDIVNILDKYKAESEEI